MLMKDLLLESPTDTVARFYLEASKDSERLYNLEDVLYKEKNQKYYDDYFQKWFKEDIVSVFTKPVAESHAEYTNIPKSSKLQSPGYRGLQYALAAAGLPYNHSVQDYEINPARIMATQAIDAAKNSNDV